jgi:hypothetical protein
MNDKPDKPDTKTVAVSDIDRLRTHAAAALRDVRATLDTYGSVRTDSLLAAAEQNLLDILEMEILK